MLDVTPGRMDQISDTLCCLYTTEVAKVRVIIWPPASGASAEQIPRPYSRADENARSLNGHIGMTPDQIMTNESVSFG